MLRLLIDENLNHRILRGLRLVVPQLECVIAQNAGLKAVPDPQLLASCAEQALVLVTHDVHTVPKHAFERVKAGQPMPGVVIVPDNLEIGAAISDLALVVECATAAEMQNVVLYLPL
jgi:predicted nuclease of predicted toxin-antitoxin system